MAGDDALGLILLPCMCILCCFEMSKSNQAVNAPPNHSRIIADLEYLY